MKILMTAPHQGIHTGGSVQLGQLAGEMARRGHRVTALFKRPDNPEVPLDPSLEPLIKAGVRVDRYRFRGMGHAGNIAEILRLRRFLKAEQFDVVHCFKGMDFDFVTLASLGIDIPALFVTRGNGTPLDFINRIKYRRSKVKAIIAVCEELKKDPLTKDVFVMFLTARGKAASERTGKQKGGDDFMVKPFEPRELREKVKKALGVL